VAVLRAGHLGMGCVRRDHGKGKKEEEEEEERMRGKSERVSR